MTPYPSNRDGTLYALRFIKWLADSGAANEIGPAAFALLVAVVTVEDEICYCRAPTFHNDQLGKRCGIGSEPALSRARDRAIEAGLLVYEPGPSRRRPGRYFTTGINDESLVMRNESVCPPTKEPILKKTNARTHPETRSKPNPFRPPTLEEVRAYCRERRNQVDPQAWLDHYEANGWRVGRNPMQDWRAAVRTWERNGIVGRQTESQPVYRDLDAARNGKAIA